MIAAPVDSRRFAALLRRFRQRAGFTQDLLAVAAGYSQVYVSLLERGQRTPLPTTVELLAAALRLSASERAIFAYAAHGVPDPSFSAAAHPPSSRSALERHLAGAGPPVLLVTGDPGIGKTQLLCEAAAQGRASGWTVLEGGCQHSGEQQSGSPVLAALAAYGRTLAHADWRAALAGVDWRAHALLEPDVVGAPAPPGWRPTPGQDRRLLFRAVSQVLSNLAGQAGTLLVFDDLQWAGADALDLLALLVRDARERPLRLVGAYRGAEEHAVDSLAVWLADLAAAGLATRLHLGPPPPAAAPAQWDWPPSTSTEHDLREARR
jgi:transcriptional regulator with XRE-family HTH domain